MNVLVNIRNNHVLGLAPASNEPKLQKAFKLRRLHFVFGIGLIACHPQRCGVQDLCVLNGPSGEFSVICQKYPL
jgi:hypothetical protein